MGQTIFLLIADVLKYLFVILIYLFIFSVIKMIYLDISDTKKMSKALSDSTCYLKLVNLRSEFSFKIYESYSIGDMTVIGRSRKSDIYIPDPVLSKNHARIFYYEGDYYLQDLESTNGTYLNGKKLSKKAVKIKDSDKITFGVICFLFVDLDGTKKGD
jgi:hypothetical protein